MTKIFPLGAIAILGVLAGPPALAQDKTLSITLVGQSMIRSGLQPRRQNRCRR
jgi:hypothetical protein